MFKLFKTKEERDLAFVSKMWERPKRTVKLRLIIKTRITTFMVSLPWVMTLPSGIH